MLYKIDAGRMLIQLNRTTILDITPDDTLIIEGLTTQPYTWTHHDAQQVESNPDHDIYLILEQKQEQLFPTGIYIAT